MPDFLANARSVICAAVEYQGGTRAIASQTIEEKIRNNTQLVLEEATRIGRLFRQVAIELARQCIRWTIG